MSKNKPNVAIVGLGFGTQFIPIYHCYPWTEMYAICRRAWSFQDRRGYRRWLH